jgi:PRC-barrel domain
MLCTYRSAKAMALAALLGAAAGSALAQQHPQRGWAVIAASSEKPAVDSASKDTRQLSPEEKMQRRFPQPARVGDLIGLPVLDDDDRTLGRIKHVVRTQAGKLQLIVPYGGFLGWRQRLIAVPIEVVAIAGRQLAALDMTRAEFDAAPAWNGALTTPLAPDDVIRVALYRR